MNRDIIAGLISTGLAVAPEAEVIEEYVEGSVQAFEKSQLAKVIAGMVERAFGTVAGRETVAKLAPYLTKDAADDAEGLAKDIEDAKFGPKP